MMTDEYNDDDKIALIDCSKLKYIVKSMYVRNRRISRFEFEIRCDTADTIV